MIYLHSQLEFGRTDRLGISVPAVTQRRSRTGQPTESEMAMARVRITADSLTVTAVTYVDQAGYDALSVSAVAEELDVAPSALYTHCEGLEGLRSLIAIAACHNLADCIRTAAIGMAGDTALSAMGHAYRRFALDHPGQFAAILRSPRVADGSLRLAGRTVVDVFTLVFTAMGLGPDQSVLAARSSHSAIHGFLALEHVNGTEDRHDDEYRHLLETLRRGLNSSQSPADEQQPTA